METNKKNDFFKEFEDNITIENKEEVKFDSNQRTPQWREDRRGKITGSCVKMLMTGQSKKKKDWGSHTTLTDFGATAFEYIETRAIEKYCGKPIEGAVTYAMHRGTELEPEAFEYVNRTRKHTAIEKCDFVPFLINAGASPDGVYRVEGTNTLAVEIKCPEKHTNHTGYMHEVFAENHPYFWQFQAEMLALGVSKLLFFSYHPFFPENLRLIQKTVVLSELHISAMLFRIIIAERIVQGLIISDFEKTPRELYDVAIEDVPHDSEAIKEWIEINIKPLRLPNEEALKDCTDVSTEELDEIENGFLAPVIEVEVIEEITEIKFDNVPF